MKLKSAILLAALMGIATIGTVAGNLKDTAVTKKADIGTLVNPGTYALVVESVKKANLEEGVVVVSKANSATTGNSEDTTAITTLDGVMATNALVSKTTTGIDTAATNTASRQKGSLALVALVFGDTGLARNALG